jgi:hypothetical protein
MPEGFNVNRRRLCGSQRQQSLQAQLVFSFQKGVRR